MVSHTAELRLTAAEVRLAEGVQADAPVEQVAATVGLRVAAELHHDCHVGIAVLSVEPVCTWSCAGAWLGG